MLALVVAYAVVATLTVAGVAFSIHRDRELIGTPRAIVLFAGSMVAPVVGYFQLEQVHGMNPWQAAWATLGVLWIALICTGGRLVLITDWVLDGPEGDKYKRRVKNSQLSFIACVVITAASVLVFNPSSLD